MPRVSRLRFLMLLINHRGAFIRGACLLAMSASYPGGSEMVSPLPKGVIYHDPRDFFLP